MLVRLAISLTVLRTSSDAEPDLEILALRHQVAVLRRQVKRPDLLPADPMILAALGLRLPPGRLLLSPSTQLRWHHELVRRRWSAFRQRPRERTPLGSHPRTASAGLVAALLDHPAYETAEVQARLVERPRMANDIALLATLEGRQLRVSDREGEETIVVASDQPFIRSLDRLGLVALEPSLVHPQSTWNPSG